MIVSRKLLMIIAAAIWYAGGIILILKGGSLIAEAYQLDSSSFWAGLALIVGATAGLLKARFWFNKVCKKNVVRINALESPRLWQFYRPGFLLFLAVIMPTGALMSKAAAGNYTLLCLVGALDISIAFALLTSSLVFWKLKAFKST